MTDVCICVYHLPLPWIPWSLLLVWLVHWAVPRRARWSTSTMTSAQTWSWWRSVSRYPSSVSVCLTLTCAAISLSVSLPHWSVSSSIILDVCLYCCLLHVLVCPVITTRESAYTSPSFLLCIPCHPGQRWWWHDLGSCCPGDFEVCVITMHTHTCYNTYLHHMHMCSSSVATIGRRYRSVLSYHKNRWLLTYLPFCLGWTAMCYIYIVFLQNTGS